MPPLVSVLIPAHNAQPWLARCIRSALSQSWPHIELVIVDDGSSDGTLAVARTFESRRVKVVTQPNRGASAARNQALALAQGDLIQWLDADDLIAPDKIARQVACLADGAASTVLASGPWARFHACSERARFVPTALWEDMPPAEWLFRKLNYNLWMAIESWLVSRALTDAAGPWDEALSLDDDGEYFSRVLMHASYVRFVDGARSFCRTGNAGSLSSTITLTDRKRDSMFVSLTRYVERMASLENSERTRGASLALLSRHLVMFDPDRPDLVERLVQLAQPLGGTPVMQDGIELRHKWLVSVFGRPMVLAAQRLIRQCRGTLSTRFDEAMCLHHRALQALRRR